MGEDKGSQAYGNRTVPQVRLAHDCLTKVCGRAWVSVNADQVEAPAYSGLPVIVDSRRDAGPAAGLLCAFEFRPDTAWLVLAVDMPRVSAGLLKNLIAQRDSSRIATLHRHADGTLEPLCAIWEPSARAVIADELQTGRGSLRAVAERADVAVAQLPEPERLQNANTPAQRRRLNHLVESAPGENPDNGCGDA